MAILMADRVSVCVDHRMLLDGVSLTLAEGSMTALIGPNGAGKSTLLKALAGLLAPTGGMVTLAGRALADWPRRELGRQIGYVPQLAEKSPMVEVLDFVILSRYAHADTWFGAVSAAQETAARSALATAGVDGLIGRDLSTLSGGERQKVMIAAALAQSAPVLLLDEPTAFLDLRGQLEILALLNRIRHEQGVTMLAVMHDLNQGVMQADQVIVLRDGRVLFSGAPKDALCAKAFARAFDLAVDTLTIPGSTHPWLVPRLPSAMPTHPTQKSPEVSRE